MDDNVLLLTDENGNQLTMEKLFWFDSEEYGKTYVVFRDPKDETGEVHALSMDKDGVMYQIENEDEWNMIEEVFEAFLDEQEEN